MALTRWPVKLLLIKKGAKMENQNIKITEIDSETISIFIPINIRKRSGYTTMILPNGDQRCNRMMTNPKNYNEKLIDAFVKAHKWQKMLKEGEIGSLSEVAKIEKTDDSYVRKVFKLNYVAPFIVEAVLKGEQPDSLKLKDFTHKNIPDLWEEQKEVFGF